MGITDEQETGPVAGVGKIWILPDVFLSKVQSLRLRNMLLLHVAVKVISYIFSCLVIRNSPACGDDVSNACKDKPPGEAHQAFADVEPSYIGGTGVQHNGLKG